VVSTEVNYRADMRKPFSTLVMVLVAALMFSGCVADITTGGERLTAPTPALPDSPNDEQADPPEQQAEQPCEDVMFQRAQGSIRAQQSALAAQDFEAARAFASQSFQQGVSVDQFQRIIQGRYAFLLNDPPVSFVECQRREDSALIRVEVGGSPIRIMLYQVVLENDVWRIDAATTAGSREEVTT